MANPFLYQPQTSQQFINAFQQPPAKQIYGPMPSSTFQQNFTANTKPASTGGTGGGVTYALPQQQPQQQQPSGPSLNDTYRREQEGLINSGYDSYFNQLNDMLNTDLPAQRSAQEGIANESYNQGINQLTSQKNAQLTNLETTQAKSLKDLSSNVKNLFEAGNTYLGTRGAGDSSAANQYSYAVSQMGTKARGDITSQVAQRRQQIDDIFNSESSRLESEKNIQLLQISNWFSQASQQAKQMMAQGQLSRSTDLQNLSTQLYNQAMSALQQVNSDSINRRNALMSWASSNAKSVGEVMNTLSSMGVYQPQTSLQGGMPNMTSGGQNYLPIGYGSQGGQKKDIYGNPIG